MVERNNETIFSLNADKVNQLVKPCCKPTIDSKMKTALLLFFLLFFALASHSQKTKTWKINDSVYGEIETLSKACKKKNAGDSIQLFFIANFFHDTVKIVLGKDTLADTVLTTRKEFIENGIKQSEVNWFLYLPKVRISHHHEKYIYYLINNEKFRFPFKRGYLLLYFSNNSFENIKGKSRRVYSLEYTNEYLGRL